MEDANWLDGLKVGDEVCYHTRYHGYVFETIEKITPTKQIKTKNHTFKNGYCRTGTWDAGLTLQPITQKVLDTARKSHLYGEIKNTKFEILSLDQLERISIIIKEVIGNEKQNSRN
jgi:hypothetical protein